MTNPCTNAVLQMGKCAQIEPMIGIVRRSEQGRRPPDLEAVNFSQFATSRAISRTRRYHPTGGKQNACLPILARNKRFRFM
jgi:hypothetical protein